MKKHFKKELKRREALAMELYGSTKYNIIEKNHKRIIWLRKKLGIKNEPKRLSLAEILIQRGLLNGSTES